MFTSQVFSEMLVKHRTTITREEDHRMRLPVDMEMCYVTIRHHDTEYFSRNEALYRASILAHCHQNDAALSSQPPSETPSLPNTSFFIMLHHPAHPLRGLNGELAGVYNRITNNTVTSKPPKNKMFYVKKAGHIHPKHLFHPTW